METWLIILVICSVHLVIAIELTQPYQPQYDCLHGKNNYKFPNTSDVKLGEYHLMSTSRLNLSLTHTIGTWSPNKSTDDPTVTYIEIDRWNPFKMSEFLGFGSTFTDSDFDIFQRLPTILCDCIFESIFSADGLNFELLRVPIDRNFEMKRREYLNRLSRRPLNKQLKIVAAILSENFDTNLMESLQKLFNSTTNSTKDENQIEIMSLDFNFTEPAQNVTDKVNQIHESISAFNQTNAEFLAPKICLTDCTLRIEEPWLFQLEKSRENILNQIDMISLTNHSVPPKFLCRAYKKYQKPIVFTEIEVNQSTVAQVDLWLKTKELIDRLMSLLQQNIVGYFEHSLNSLIILDESGTNLSKHPAFYAMAHFSRHILPNSKRLAATLCGPVMSGIQTVAYLRSDGKIVILLYNSNEVPMPVNIVDKQIGQFNIILPANSINSIVYCI